MQWLELTWESVALVVAGTVVLRIAGRKAISQMTIAQTVIMISIGSLIIQPIVETSVLRTIVAAAIFVAVLLLMEYLQVRWDWLETLLSGKAVPVIENGKPITANLRRMRFTVDKLEMRLRQQGITALTDIKSATLEANGQLGYELMPHARPVTAGDLERLLRAMQPGGLPPGVLDALQGGQAAAPLLKEVREGRHQKPTPKKLR